MIFDFAEAVIDLATLEAVRARLAGASFERYDVPDRGRYELNQTHDEPELFERLLRHAWQRLGGAALRPAARRWTRLRRGDYALFKDDGRRWAGGDYELCLDLSAAPSREGQSSTPLPTVARRCPSVPAALPSSTGAVRCRATSGTSGSASATARSCDSRWSSSRRSRRAIVSPCSARASSSVSSAPPPAPAAGQR